MSQKEEGKPDLNRREKHGLEIMMACASEMHKCSPVLKERLTMKDKRGFAYYRMALGLMDKALGLVYDTTPVRQLKQIYAVCKSGAVHLTASPALTPVSYTAVKNSDLNQLCAASVNQKCALCVQNGMEARQCELRKTLMTIWPPKELPKFGDCPYQGVRWFENAGEISEDDEEK